MTGQSIRLDVPQIKEAMEIGMSAGEVATVEFIRENYSGHMSPQLEGFLDKIVSAAYKKLEGVFEVPAEDIALDVQALFPK